MVNARSGSWERSAMGKVAVVLDGAWERSWGTRSTCRWTTSGPGPAERELR